MNPQVHDCRVWMRLFFLSFRDEGLFAASPGFQSLLLSLIRHFVAVYERDAPPFAEEAMRWSESSARVDAYVAAGCRMPDL